MKGTTGRECRIEIPSLLIQLIKEETTMPRKAKTPAEKAAATEAQAQRREAKKAAATEARAQRREAQAQAAEQRREAKKAVAPAREYAQALIRQYEQIASPEHLRRMEQFLNDLCRAVEVAFEEAGKDLNRIERGLNPCQPSLLRQRLSNLVGGF